MVRKSATIFSIILLSHWGISQSVFKDNIFYPSAGISVQKHVFGELSLCYGSGATTTGSCGSVDIIFQKLGSEFTFDNKNLVLGPKFSVENVYEFIGAKINIIDYTDFKLQDWRFTPEIGLSLGGIIDLYYGYNIPLTKDRINCVTGNRVTLTLNLPGVW